MNLCFPPSFMNLFISVKYAFDCKIFETYNFSDIVPKDVIRINVKRLVFLVQQRARLFNNKGKLWMNID